MALKFILFEICVGNQSFALVKTNSITSKACRRWLREVQTTTTTTTTTKTVVAR